MSRERQDLAAGDAIFLAFLLHGPLTAYDIKKLMAMSVSYFWSAAHSQVYQQATRLSRDGYLKEREVEGGRRKRLLSLTPKGRSAVKRWLASPANAWELRDEGLAKLFFAADGDRDAIIAMLRERRDHHIERMRAYEDIERYLASADAPDARYQRMTLRLGQANMRASLAWLDETLDELESEG